MKVMEAQYRWTERAEFTLTRDQGLPHYIIAQYLSRIDLRIEDRIESASLKSVLVLEPNVPHGYRCEETLLHHWLHVDGNVGELITQYGIRPNRLYQLENDGDLSAIFRQIAQAYHDKGPFREQYMSLKVEELLITIGMQLRLQTTSSDLNYHVIVCLKELRFELVEHPEYNWTVSEMAKRAYMSESYFYSLYRKCFGITPNRDLIGIRIEHARRNLRSGYSVAETAEKVGYSNVYHFIRQFKEIVGVTPNQYKKQRRHTLF